jgi:hypothetical protein
LQNRITCSIQPEPGPHFRMYKTPREKSSSLNQGRFPPLRTPASQVESRKLFRSTINRMAEDGSYASTHNWPCRGLRALSILASLPLRAMLPWKRSQELLSHPNFRIQATLVRRRLQGGISDRTGLRQSSCRKKARKTAPARNVARAFGKHLAI